MKSDRNNPMFMPYPNVNMQGMYPIMPGVNELENRINSLERIVKRLDTRVSRLESNNGIYNTETSYNTSLPDMYNQNAYPNALQMM